MATIIVTPIRGRFPHVQPGSVRRGLGQSLPEPYYVGQEPGGILEGLGEEILNTYALWALYGITGVVVLILLLRR